MKYAIGDVHGCGVELNQLLRELYANHKTDEIYLVGDVFDRGMFPHLVWQLIHDFQMKVILGNHERKLARMMRGGEGYYPPHYQWCRANLNQHGITDEMILNFIDGLPPLLVLENDKTIITHGGVLLDEPTKHNTSANTYGSLDEHRPMPRGDNKVASFWWDHYKGEYLVLYGHIVTTDFEPRLRHNSIGIDTACVHGGKLTAYCLDTKEFYSVPAIVDWHSKLKEELTSKQS